MKKWLIIIVFIILSLKGVGNTEEADIGIGFGFSKLMGEVGEYYNLGGSINCDIFQPISPNISVGVHIAYNEWTLKSKEVKEVIDFKIKVREVIPTIRLTTIEGERINYFSQVGIGYQRVKASVKLLDKFKIEAKGATIVLKLGGGIDINIEGNINLEINPTYNTNLSNISEGEGYFTINMGITFKELIFL